MHKQFELAWANEYPDHPDGSAKFEKDKNGMYLRVEVRTGFAMFNAGLQHKSQE